MAGNSGCLLDLVNHKTRSTICSRHVGHLNILSDQSIRIHSPLHLRVSSARTAEKNLRHVISRDMSKSVHNETDFCNALPPTLAIMKPHNILCSIK